VELAAVVSGEAAEVDQEALAELAEVEVKEAEVDLEMLATDQESEEVGLDLELVEADLDLELAEADPALAEVDLEAAEVEVPELVVDQLEAASAHLAQPALLAQVLTLEPNWELDQLDQLAVGAAAVTLGSLAMDQAESAEAIKPVLLKVTSTATVLEPVTMVKSINNE
jgi:hypothetical protein